MHVTNLLKVCPQRTFKLLNKTVSINSTTLKLIGIFPLKPQPATMNGSKIENLSNCDSPSVSSPFYAS